MMSIFERHSFETGDTVLHKLDEEIVERCYKRPSGTKELTEKLDEATEGVVLDKRIFVGAKNEKVSY